MVQGHPPRAETQQGAIPLPPPRRIPGPMPRHSPTVLCPPGLWVLHVSRAGSSVPRYPRVPTLPSGVPMSPARFPVSRCPSEPQAITALPVLRSSRGPSLPPCVPTCRYCSPCPGAPTTPGQYPAPLLTPLPRCQQPEDPPRSLPCPLSRLPVLIPCPSPGFPISRNIMAPHAPRAVLRRCVLRAAHVPAARRHHHRHSPGGCPAQPTCA